MENSLALNHKLDELIESVKSIPMETNEDNLAKHEYHEQQDLVFQNKDFKSHETTKETFRQLEHSDQISEKDSYKLEHEFEMAREGVKILRFKFGLYSKTHDKHIGELDKMVDEAENLSPQSTPQVLPSIKVYTPPVTYPEEVEDTIITRLEIEPLDHTILEDLGLNTCSPDIFDDLVSNQFFPPSKTTNLRNEITRFQQRFDESFYEAWERFNDLLRACPHHGFSELHQLDTFYNALNVNDQDSLNSAMGTSSSTPAISSDVAELKDMVKALLLDKKNQSLAPTPSTTPAPVKAVEPNCVTCGGTHAYQNCPATHQNAYRDNILEYVTQAAAANYNQGNTGF
nr:hypothetical protein [Tanacetum cinerariifolium]